MIKEKDIKIEVSEEKYAYAKLSGSIQEPLFIIVHGLATSMDTGLYKSSVGWFSDKGYATLRFNLYGEESDARKMIDTTLKINAEDINLVVKHAKKMGFKKIYMTGHSYGAVAILLAKNLHVDKISLWEPSYKVSFKNSALDKDMSTFIESQNGYLMNWPKPIMIGEKMADEAESLDWDILAQGFNIPTQIIYAGNGYLEKGSKHYFGITNEPKDLVKIYNATHNFNDSKEIMEKLFIETERWFNRKD